jgi:hypothetical protein
MSSQPDRPLLSFCVNNSNIWPQDLENIKLDHRVQDVLAQRTNQIYPHPLSSSPCSNFAQEQIHLDPFGQKGLQFPNCVDQNGHPSLQSYYSPYEQIILPASDNVNLLNIRTESRLIFPLNAPNVPIGCLTNPDGNKARNTDGMSRHVSNRDCLTPWQTENLKAQRNASNRQLFQDFNRNEIRNSMYPDIDRNMFDNISKEIYKTRDDRNDFILWGINDPGTDSPCQVVKPMTSLTPN